MIIRPIIREDATGLNLAVNTVCAERVFVATVDGFTQAQTDQFVKSMIEKKQIIFVAVDHQRLVGWCSVIKKQMTGFKHVAELGLGLIKRFRGQGLGNALLVKALNQARSSDIEKIELEVYSDNQAAIHLYLNVGFQIEGTRVRARKIDGRYQDVTHMGLFLRQSNGDT